MWSAAIATWSRSSHPLGPPRISLPRMAPHRCSHGCCSLYEAQWHSGPRWGSPSPHCSHCPYSRSADYWQRSPSRRWSSRRRLRSHAWSPTQTLGPWHIFPDPQKSTPENKRNESQLTTRPGEFFFTVNVADWRLRFGMFACLLYRRSALLLLLLTASTRLLALPLFCRKCGHFSVGNCRRDGEWLWLGEPSVYHKLLFTAPGMLPTLPELLQSTWGQAPTQTYIFKLCSP